MPITLPSITRRRFLQVSAASGAALCFPFSLTGTEKEGGERNPDCFALLSDTHIPGERTTVRQGVNAVDNLRLIRKDVLASPARPSMLFVSGDCGHLAGKREDYVTLVEEVQPLREAGITVNFMMGNHDDRDVFIDVCNWANPRKEERQVPGKHVSVVETPKANWFLLDSLQKTDFVQGKFGTEMLDWLAKELDARPGKPAILMAHHNLDSRNDPETAALLDTKAFWSVIQSRKQVKAYIYGHTHFWRTETKDGIQLINVPATAWKFVETEPTAWVLAELRDDGIVLTLRSLDPAHKQHDKKTELTWRV